MNTPKRAASPPSRGIERRLAAILHADAYGYSRLINEDESGTLRVLTPALAMLRELVQQHGGSAVGSRGDSLLAEFPSVVAAVQCAIEMQQEMQAKTTDLPENKRIAFRIGISLGEIVIDGDQPHGDGINIAVRIEGLAEPGEICISDIVYNQVKNKLSLQYDDLGPQQLKNIPEPGRVYRIVLNEAAWAVVEAAQQHRRQLQQVSTPRRSRVVVVSVLMFVLLLGGIAAVRYVFLPVPSTEHPTLSPQSSAPDPQSLPPNPQPLPDKPSIVVLPFDNLSGDPQQDYFSNGITDVLTSDLSRIASLFVIARNTAFSIGKSRNVQEVGRELGVRYVLEGSVQKAGDQVRIVAQLIDTTTGTHLWSERYDRPLKDIFALQDDIVQKIVTTLKLQLTLQEQGVVMRKRTDNLQAYDTFLRGVEYFLRFTKEANAQARPLFEKTIELDPRYAEAYAYLGWSCLIPWMFQWNPDPQTLQRAFDLGQQALVLDDSLPRAHIILSHVYMFQGKYEPAVAAAERALALDPNDADSYVVLASIFNFFGERTTEAIVLIEKAIRLNPRYPNQYPFQLGWAYRLVGRYEEAIVALKQALLRNPNWLFAYLHLCGNYLSLWTSQLRHDPQTLNRGLEAAQQMVALDAASPWSHRALSEAYLWKKQYEQANAEAEQVLALNPSRGAIYTGLANILSFLGRPEEALGSAEKAVRLNPRPSLWDLVYLGHTDYLTGRSEEAIAALKKSLNGSPADLDAHLLLAAVYSELGREAEAQAEAAAVLRINPNWSLEVWKQRVPYKDPAMLERVFAALRKAGLR